MSPFDAYVATYWRSMSTMSGRLPLAACATNFCASKLPWLIVTFVLSFFNWAAA